MNIENELESNSIKVIPDGVDESERDKLVQFEKTPDKMYQKKYFTQVSAISLVSTKLSYDSLNLA